MAIPSFNELLQQAREISQQNADSEASARRGQAIAGGVSGFVNQLLTTSTGPEKTYTSTLSPTGSN